MLIASMMMHSAFAAVTSMALCLLPLPNPSGAARGGRAAVRVSLPAMGPQHELLPDDLVLYTGICG